MTNEHKNYPALIGAIAGDTIGSIYEFNNTKHTDFELLQPSMNYTDDSLMTLAVADWLLNRNQADDDAHLLTNTMRYWAYKYPCPMGGYGSRFHRWLLSPSPKPYNSWGNGAAMRVSAVGYAADSIEQAMDLAKRSAEITHNHPEGIKGAQATAAAIFMARTGSSKEEIRDYVEQHFDYNLHRTCDEIRPIYHFEESCQGTVPEAMVAFFDSHDFESAMRLAVSLGGDSDTLACITGGIAAAYYNDIPQAIVDFVVNNLPTDLIEVANNFCVRYGYKTLAKPSRHRGDRITPARITNLKPNEVFVFGSNLAGFHGGGAAHIAHAKFGAIWGQGVGMQGQSYAIPTMQGGVETIKPYVDQFIDYARQNSIYRFYVTRIGCGIAGFTDEEIAPLFREAVDVENICLPTEWWALLDR